MTCILSRNLWSARDEPASTRRRARLNRIAFFKSSWKKNRYSFQSTFHQHAPRIFRVRKCVSACVLCVLVERKEEEGESFIPGRRKEKILTGDCGTGRKNRKAQSETVPEAEK